MTILSAQLIKIYANIKSNSICKPCAFTWNVCDVQLGSMINFSESVYVHVYKVPPQQKVIRNGQKWICLSIIDNIVHFRQRLVVLVAG